MTGGTYGWAVSVGRGGSCCTVPVRDDPLGSETTGDTSRNYETASFLSGPELAAVSYRGKHLAMKVLRLPYHLRVVQVTVNRPRGTWGPASGWPPVHLTALGSNGRALPRAHTYDGPSVASIWWKRGQRTPHGPCQLAPDGLQGLSAQWGHVASAIRPFGARISGRAFFSCIDTEYYLHRWPLNVAILLDAQRPGVTPAPLPAMAAVPGAPGYFDIHKGWNGAITARRFHRYWLLVSGGSGRAQRLEVLRHLSARVRLPS